MVHCCGGAPAAANIITTCAAIMPRRAASHCGGAAHRGWGRGRGSPAVARKAATKLGGLWGITKLQRLHIDGPTAQAIATSCLEQLRVPLCDQAHTCQAHLEHRARLAATAQRQHGVAEAAASLCHRRLVLQARILKGGKGISRQHLSPLVAVVAAGGVTGGAGH